MQCACITIEGMPEPALHIPRLPYYNIHCEVVWHFKQEITKGSKMAMWKRGWNPTSKHANIVTYIASQLYIVSQPQQHRFGLVEMKARNEQAFLRPYNIAITDIGIAWLCSIQHL